MNNELENMEGRSHGLISGTIMVFACKTDEVHKKKLKMMVTFSLKVHVRVAIP